MKKPKLSGNNRGELDAALARIMVFRTDHNDLDDCGKCSITVFCFFKVLIVSWPADHHNDHDVDEHGDLGDHDDDLYGDDR